MSDDKEYISQLPSRVNLQFAGLENKDLTKGHLIDAFSYSDAKALPINVKGKQIIDSMDKAISYEKIQAEAHLAMAAKYKCPDEAPKGIPSSYTLGGYPSSSFENLPKLYSYDQRRKYDTSSDNGYKTMEMGSSDSYGTEEKKDLSTYEKMCEYNKHINKAIECMVEVKIAQTVKNGIDEKKTYPLSVRQAAALGL